MQDEYESCFLRNWSKWSAFVHKWEQIGAEKINIFPFEWIWFMTDICSCFNHKLNDFFCSIYYLLLNLTL